MRPTRTLATLVVVLVALAGCQGGGDDPSGTPTPASDSTSPSGSADASQDPAAGIRQLFHAALEPLLDQQVIDFRHDVYSGDALAVETRGRAFQQAGWQARTTSPKTLGSHDAPEGDEVKGAMQVRAVGDDLFMQLSTWTPPLAGCWLRTGKGQVPGGQLAMTAGVPGYITLLGALEPLELVSSSDQTSVFAAQVSLRVALQLLTTGVLGLLQLDADQLDGAPVPIGVEVSGDVVSGIELHGADLVAAVRAAGGDVTADAEATLQQLQIRVAYRAGPADAPKVVAPDDGLVMTNAEARADQGCR